MSLTEGNGVSVSMPVAPIGYGNGYGGGYPVASYPIAYPVAYGNGGGFGDGFGGDWSWIIILFLFAMFGGGFGGFGGMMGADMFNMFPWLLASDNNTNAVVSSGFNQAATADLKYTVATENCADRAALSDGVRDIIASNTAQTQVILDKLCALELDGVKNQLAQAQRENTALQNAVNMANMQASQTAQTAQILAGQAAEVDTMYNRLKNCPVPSMPVYGNNTPIFTCNNGCGNNSTGCGCGCGVT